MKSDVEQKSVLPRLPSKHYRPLKRLAIPPHEIAAALLMATFDAARPAYETDELTLNAVAPKLSSSRPYRQRHP